MINQKSFLALFSFVLFSVEVPAQNLTSGQDGLHGLKQVGVVIDLSESAINAGLSFNQLTNDVKLRLRGNGITVDGGSHSFIYVGVTVVGLDFGLGGRSVGFAANTEVEFRELVIFKRDPNKMIRGSTWTTPSSITISPNRNSLVQGVRQEIRDMADRFCSAYLAANPKTQ